MSEKKQINNKFDLKTILISILGILCVGIFIFGFNNSFDYNNKKRELDFKIKMYQHIDDSLVNIAKHKEAEYFILENKFQYDSIILDSFKEEYYNAVYNAKESEKNANYYRNKYVDVKNKVIYLETHILNIKGDSLLISLSKKIN